MMSKRVVIRGIALRSSLAHRATDRSVLLLLHVRLLSIGIWPLGIVKAIAVISARRVEILSHCWSMGIDGPHILLTLPVRRVGIK